MNNILNEQEVTLSIVIPTYNTEIYIIEMLQSLSNINKNSTELIIVDDSSRDRTVELTKNWLENNNFKYRLLVNDENRGPGYSRNRGLALAEGRYVTFFDSDDICLSYLYSETISAMDMHDIDLCILRAKSFDDKSQSVYEFPGMQHWREIMGERDYKITTVNRDPRITGLAPNTMNKIYRTSVIRENEIYFPENLIFEDLYFYASSLLKVNKILLINRDILLYRVNREGQLTVLANGKHNDIIDIGRLILSLNKENNFSALAWSTLIGSLIKLITWCSENCDFYSKKEFINGSMNLFQSIPQYIFEMYKDNFPLSLWEKNIITCYQTNNKDILETVAEGGFPELKNEIKKDNDNDNDNDLLHQINNTLNQLISQQRDGWANDRFNVLNEKIDIIKNSLHYYNDLFENSAKNNSYTLEKMEDILLIIHHDIELRGDESNTLLYEKIVKFVNDIKNKLK